MAKSEVSVNPDLVRERAGATFSIEEMTNMWDGGAESTQHRRKIENLAYSDSELCGSNIHHLSREELFSEMMRRHAHAYRMIQKHKLTSAEDQMLFQRAALARGAGISGLALHDLAFMPTLRMQASDEQLARWLPLIESFQMIGCYAQTELGHGTFIRGLETTATYDPMAKEFVLNTPHITSAKWWVGSLGLTANHAVVMAQLHCMGRNHGLHAFLLRLRDERQIPLRGIIVGDVGPKFGSNAAENGFMRLDSVRIPRENMLMRFAKVLEDGTYVKADNDKMVYSGMLALRGLVFPMGSTTALANAVAIAIRYSCVRRQSELTPGQREPQILDYQTQQHKLLPLLATAYAFKFSALSMMDLFNEIMLEVQGGNYRRLVEAHALTSGMKAVFAAKGAAGIETCRLACGGHGYLQASRLPELYAVNVAIITVEGESTVLLLQTARYLMKIYNQKQGKGKIDDLTSYLHVSHDNGTREASKKFSSGFEQDSFLEAFEFRAFCIRLRPVYFSVGRVKSINFIFKVSKAAKQLQKFMGEGVSLEIAFNLTSVKLLKAANAHIDYVVLRLFMARLRSVQCSAAVRAALTALCTLHAVDGIVQNAGDYLSEGYLSRDDVTALTERQWTLYGALRHDALACVDAFDMDHELESSVLGRYDGHVYESLLKSAHQSTLNATQVHQSFNDHLKPLQQLSQSKL